MLKKYPLECFLIVVIILLLLGYGVYLVTPTFTSWWSMHWLLASMIITTIIAGGTVHKWVPLFWRAFNAVADFLQNWQDRYESRLMLAEARGRMRAGHDVEYHNTVTGVQLKVSNPLLKPSSVKIQELHAGQQLLGQGVTLPGPMLMLDVMRQWDLRLDNLFLAYGKGMQPIACSLEGFMHVAHDAPTGQGKTSQFYAEIIQLLKLNVRVMLANPHFAPVGKKGEDWGPIARAIEMQGQIEVAPGICLPGIIRNFENIVAVLKWLAKSEVDRRFTMQAEGNYDYEPIYLFIDEWPAIVARFPEAAEYLREILQRGRAVEVCVDTNSQGFLQEDVDLKGSARENFNTAYHMGGSVHSGSKLLDMPIKDINALLKNEQIALGKGIALLRNNQGSPQAQLVRLPYAQNDYAYYMLGRADDWMLPEIRSKQAYSGASSNQVSSVVLEGTSEGALEAVGRYVEEKNDSMQFELKRLMVDIGKMKANGLSNDAILKQYGLNPGGRNNQNLKAVAEVISELETEEA